MTPPTAVLTPPAGASPIALPLHHQAIRPSHSPASLWALREQINARAEERRSGPLAVVLYALTGPHGDPTEHLDLTRQVADRKHAQVHAVFSDTSGDLDPALRPGWADVLRTLAHREAQAVVCVSRTAVSSHNTLYQQQLQRLGDHHTALYLFRHETAL
ncbi:hypothetical protein [Streptomyces albipurpureus]|uniref:Resolvase/invertase-type recombinase catalytic domain-containing protein n=1 Tax=Streptomyces albipurpureus TaxID=2897419 RepID=A0ABT0UWA8_9ACTN|nr:hypothetical protein [Streptomyces sp. CWNU-1]MCM2392729.1 hypothetical protein [Streptomyces sp. CWNU-1]